MIIGSVKPSVSITNAIAVKTLAFIKLGCIYSPLWNKLYRLYRKRLKKRLTEINDVSLTYENNKNKLYLRGGVHIVD